MNKTLPFKCLAGLALSALLLGGCVGSDLNPDDSTAESIDEALAARAHDPGPGDVTVSLSANAMNVAASESVAVNVTFTNSANEPVRLLSWYTAAGGLKEDLFDITRDLQPVAFTGAHRKRVAPRLKDYVVLLP